MFPGTKLETMKKSCNPLIDSCEMKYELVISKLRLEDSELQWGMGRFLPVQKVGQITTVAHIRDGDVGAVWF